MPSSHNPDRLAVAFDDTHAVANAGLLLPATLAQRLGIQQLGDELVDLGDRAGAAHPGSKLLTLIHTMIAGGDCINDADLLRAGATAAVLGHRVLAPSTLGTFLRAFTFGHIRQLDRLAEQALTRAWTAGAGPGQGPLTIDVDSTICQVYGQAKQGAAYGYTRVLGYHPLLATRADTGELLHARMRTGRANTDFPGDDPAGQTLALGRVQQLQQLDPPIRARLRQVSESASLQARLPGGGEGWVVYLDEFDSQEEAIEFCAQRGAELEAQGHDCAAP